MIELQEFLKPFKSIHVQKFWDGLKNQKLLTTKCKKCGEKFFPPRSRCPKCLSKELEWFKISGEGILYSWTSIENQVKAPYILGIVELKEQIGRSISKIQASEKELKIGMKMRIQFVKLGDSYYFIWIPILNK